MFSDLVISAVLELVTTLNLFGKTQLTLAVDGLNSNIEDFQIISRTF